MTLQYSAIIFVKGTARRILVSRKHLHLSVHFTQLGLGPVISFTGPLLRRND